jgi:hypothetical protein
VTSPAHIDQGEPTLGGPAVATEHRAPADRPVAAPDPAAPPAGRRRLRPVNLDLRNTWQIAAGAVLLPLGLALILLAWSGAAHGRVDQQQIPYLVSGGLGGLAVVTIGCFFYFAHWLYRIYDQADLHHQEAMQEQRELMRELIDAVAAGGVRPAAAGAQPAPGPSFVATQAGSNFHTASCPMVANRATGLRTLTAEEAAGMRPCRVCEPTNGAG